MPRSKTHLMIVAKKIGTGHTAGERVNIPEDMDQELGERLVETGLAIWIDGLSHAEINLWAQFAAYKRDIGKRKLNAENMMALYDRQSQETRDRLKEQGDEPVS